MTRTRTMYMHTVNDKPAIWDGRRLVVADSSHGPVRVYASMRTLIDHVSRLPRDEPKYGWLAVEVPS